MQPHGRHRHETRPEGLEAECKARSGGKPNVPATRRRQLRDDLPLRSSSVEGVETSREVPNGFGRMAALVGQAPKWRQGHERMGSGSADLGPRSAREYLEVRPRKGQGHGGSAQPIRYYRVDYQDSVGHSDHMGVGFRGGDVALAAGERPKPLKGTTNSK